MCPSASISTPLDIDVSSTDEEVLQFMGRRKAGDPVPSNIITKVNPFSVKPWDSPVGMWYLYNFEDGCSNNHWNTFKVADIGYWRFMGHLIIYRGNVATGRKITWKFYMGEEPGNITGWLMYDYQRVQKANQGISVVQDYNSMCRVFLQEDQREIISDQKSLNIEHCSPVSSDNANAGEHIESMLLRFLESEERSPPINVANQSKLEVPEQRHDRSIQDLVTTDSATDLNAFVEFSKGEYLEIGDLYRLETTSSSSDDSSGTSSNSDDCFDAEALLRDLENETSSDTKAEGFNSRFNVASHAKPIHAAIRLSQSAGSVKIINSHSADNKLVLADSSPSDGCSSKISSPVDKSEQLLSASTSTGACLRSYPKRTHSDGSESSSSSNGSGLKSVRRIAKLGKKFCCFAPL